MKTLCASMLIVVAVQAQQPQIENAKVEVKTSSGTLAAQLSQFGVGPYWAGYAEPTVPRRHGNMCNSNEVPNAPLRLEGQTALVVLARVTGGHVDELRLVSPDCRIDAGGLPFYWIENVPVSESIAWLKASPSNSAILAIALHAGEQAEKVLEELMSPAQPLQVREQVVFGLSQNGQPAAVIRLIETARADKDPRIRSKALFWLAQKAGSLQTIREAAASDPELSVKQEAVFALKQMPNNEGIPALIDVAKNHADPAVRKKAMFWLGQSTDPRALDFFAQVLKQ